MKLKEKLLSLLVRWLGFGLRARLPQVVPSPAISHDMSPDGNAVLPKVSLLALGKMATEPGQSFNALPQLPLGVIPPQLLAEDGHTHASLAMAQDNAAFCHAFLNGAMQGTGFKGYAALAELSQLSEYRSPTETLATEMTRQWISFKSTGSGNRSEQLQAIEAAFDQFKIRDKLKQAVEHDGFFGRGMLYIDMGMPELNDTPLIINKATIRQGSVQGFKVIEPVWTSPANYNATDPTAKDFYQPHSWYVMGRQIHTSRLITLIARPLPDMLKPAYNFSGLSMTQLLEPAVNAWLRTRDSVSELVHSFSTSGVKTDMQAVLSGGNGDDILHRAQLFNQMRDNRGLMLLDKDNEEFFQFHTPLGGMESLQAQAQEQMAAPCHIPLVKLFGITPHGLNASSEGEIKVFYDYIQAMQQSLLTDPLLKILQIIQLHLFGEIYDDITFEYYPLEQMNEQQEVNISKTKVEIGTALLQAGVISKEEERQRLAADPLSGYDGLGDGLSGQLPEQEQAGQSGVSDGMQAMDEAQCFWDPHKHPRNKENGQFCEVGAGLSSSILEDIKRERDPYGKLEIKANENVAGKTKTGKSTNQSNITKPDDPIQLADGSVVRGNEKYVPYGGKYFYNEKTNKWVIIPDARPVDAAYLKLKDEDRKRAVAVFSWSAANTGAQGGFLGAALANVTAKNPNTTSENVIGAYKTGAALSGMIGAPKATGLRNTAIKQTVKSPNSIKGASVAESLGRFKASTLRVLGAATSTHETVKVHATEKLWVKNKNGPRSLEDAIWFANERGAFKEGITDVKVINENTMQVVLDRNFKFRISVIDDKKFDTTISDGMNKYANYMLPRVMETSDNTHAIPRSWNSLNNGGEPTIVMRRSVLESDRKAVAIIAHEFFELKGLYLKASSTSGISIGKAQGVIDELHNGAVSFGGKIVYKMAEEGY